MTVQTLAESPKRTAPRLSWALPLLPAAISGFCFSALLYYHVQFGGGGTPHGLVQHMVVGLYSLFGFVPSVMLALLAFVWSTIWFASGEVDRIGRRTWRVLALTVALSILLGLQPATADATSGGGQLGSFLALRLESVVGYVVGTLLVSLAVLFSLLLATDMMFYRYFESLARAAAVGVSPRAEDGVEVEAVQDMKNLRLEGVFATGAAVAEQDQEEDTDQVAEPVSLKPDLVIGEDDDVSPAAASPLPSEEAYGPAGSWRSRVASRFTGEENAGSPEDTVEVLGEMDAVASAVAAGLAEASAEMEISLEEDEGADSAGVELEEVDLDGDDEEPDVALEADDEEEEEEHEEEEEEDGAEEVELEADDDDEEEEEEYEEEEEDGAEEVELEADDDEEEEEYEEEEEDGAEEVELEAGDDEEEEEYEEEEEDGAEEVELEAGEEEDEEVELEAGEEEDEEVELEADEELTESVEAAPSSMDDDLDVDLDLGDEALEEEDLVEIPRGAPTESPTRQGRLFASPGSDPELVEEAAELVQSAGRASVTFLQRRLRVGYDEARELLEILRQRGIVDGEEGALQGHVQGEAK